MPGSALRGLVVSRVTCGARHRTRALLAITVVGPTRGRPATSAQCAPRAYADGGVLQCQLRVPGDARAGVRTAGRIPRSARTCPTQPIPPNCATPGSVVTWPGRCSLSRSSPTARLTRASPRGTSCSRVRKSSDGQETARGSSRSPAPARSSDRSRRTTPPALGSRDGAAPSPAPQAPSRTTSIPPGMSPRTPDARR